jgi:ergothioneine biosynthesis protein EgtB
LTGATGSERYENDELWVSARKQMTEIDKTRQEFLCTRERTECLSSLLTEEDHLLQSMPETSPTKWHLAHTAWFFDTFLLQPRGIVTQPDDAYEFLFNSYYNAIGPQYQRGRRGLISRPGLQEVKHYRHAIDAALYDHWHTFNADEMELITLGIHHEQQHQELIITDIKHALFFNPTYPAIVNAQPDDAVFFQGADAIAPTQIRFHDFERGNYCIGSDTSFCFDNEMPRHNVFMNGFRIANRPASNGDYLEFIEDGGYQCFRYWLSEGWAWVNEQRAEAPLYWLRVDNQWMHYTLAGLRPLDLNEPVCHLNYYEAAAFAHWSGKRLPTEFEWEVAAATAKPNGNFLDCKQLHPQAAITTDPSRPAQMFGDVWEWTQSAYLPYPGFRETPGAAGEYNGKFMVNQWVLRGGSCATPPGHIRASYRNFFPVNASWQFSGVRLADDLN